METLNYNILEELNKEWTAFLDSIPWNSGNNIAEANRIFIARRKIWLRKMTKKYDVTLQQLNKHFVHDK
jgi:hypothetical protein